MNRLAHSRSPYLLQHKDNPVDWYPWGQEALDRAKQENKPILVSIGYSACHWCHVMEHESFEDEGIAELMNTYFVCIKVDREERPDVDQIYMDAIQAMGLQGGWPLNAFLMPDQKPFYGGTYFPKQGWEKLLQSIAKAYREHREKLQESAEGFARSLSVSDLERFGLQAEPALFSKEELADVYQKFAAKFDKQRGGLNRAPKFPMPSHWQYLLRYGKLFNQPEATQQAVLTLRKMAWGGIYDQLGGGFARYSVDADWFVPHFEKMLYDNAQLISLYAEAYQATREELFREVAEESLAWAQRELLSPEGGYYSALDADSEGEEGKFYCWSWQELESVLGETTELLADYFNLSEEGNWEHGKNILFRRESPESFAAKYELEAEEFKAALAAGKAKLMEHRKQRIRPGLDDKILAGWNGLMLQALAKAARVFQNKAYQEQALQLANFLKTKMTKESRLYRTYKNGSAELPAYLEDYAALISGYLALYELNFDPAWLQEAKLLSDYVLKNFSEAQDPLFYFTDASGEALIARKKEIFDNVIPSSNALMADNLQRLGLLLDLPDYRQRAEQLLGTAKKLILAEPQYLTYWADLAVRSAQPAAEIAIVGPEYTQYSKEFAAHYLPNALFSASASARKDVALLQGRNAVNGKTTIYVCYERSCKRPVFSIQEALEEMG